jgi:hypothetical protein
MDVLAKFVARNPRLVRQTWVFRRAKGNEHDCGDKPMPTNSKNPQPGTAAAMKERRAREAAQAMKDYEADRAAIRAKTERLRALRLAREAVNPPTKKAR